MIRQAAGSCLAWQVVLGVAKAGSDAKSWQHAARAWLEALFLPVVLSYNGRSHSAILFVDDFPQYGFP